MALEGKAEKSGRGFHGEEAWALVPVSCILDYKEEEQGSACGLVLLQGLCKDGMQFGKLLA